MPQTSSAPPPGLVRLGVRPSLRTYVADIWERREFAIANAIGQLRSQHLDTTLGNVWHLLNPALMISVYFLVFGVILDTDRGVTNFIGFLCIGIFVYRWAQKTIIGGAGTIVSNEGLLRSLQFPRALLPLSTLLQETMAFLPGIAVMFGIVLVTGEGITVRWLQVIPVFALQFLFCLGAAFMAARAADRFRDTLNLLPFIFRLIFYGSGVLFAVDDRFHSAFQNPWVVRIFLANPFYCFISLWRDALMTSQNIERIPWMWLSASAWTVVALVGGFLIFRAGEHEYGRG